MPRLRIESKRRALPGVATVIASVILAASTAAAPVTLETSYREVSTFGVLDVAGTADDAFDVNQLTVETPGSLDEQRTTALQAQQSSISALATQVSNVVPESFVLDGAFECVGVLAPGGTLAEGFGASVATLRFRCDASVTLRLAGTLDASGNGRAAIRIDDANNATVFERRAHQATDEFDEVVQLAVGSWVMHVDTGGYGRVDASASTPSAGSFAIVVTFGTVADAGGGVAGHLLSLSPNPMRDESTIACGVGIARGTELVIHDVAGRRVRGLGPVTGVPVRWDARDDRGARVPAGMYLIRAGDRASSRIIVTR